MNPAEREDFLYSNGKVTKIALEERLLFADLRALVTPGACVADVGCGTGEVGLAIVDMGYNVVGFDFSTVAVAAATANGLKAERADLDVDGIPLPAESVDAVYAGDVVEHVFDPLFLHEEFNRILRPGGYVFISVPHDANIRSLVRALGADSPQTQTYRRARQCKHHTFVSIPLMQHFANTAHLEVVSVVLIGGRWGRIQYWADRRMSYPDWRIPSRKRLLADRACVVLTKPY